MIDNIITAVYLFIVLLIGIMAGKKVKNLEDFSVAGRSFSYMVIFATLSASFIGGGFSIGNAEKVFLFGLVNIFALWGFSLKEILVAQFIAPKIKKYKNPISLGDIIAHHYGTGAKVITGVFYVPASWERRLAVSGISLMSSSVLTGYTAFLSVSG